MRRIKIEITILLVAIISLAASASWAWGEQGHTLITDHAIKLLPAELTPFYRANARYIVAFSMLPDDWRETHHETAPNHYIDLDMYDKPPFDKVRAAVDKDSAQKLLDKEDASKAGVLPWVVAERYAKLVTAFKNKDTEQIVLQSALLAHFVGDTHVPMHTTKNYDGDKPEEKGLHFRWETALLALTVKPEDINPTAPTKVDNILTSEFSWCIAAFGNNDAIFRADDKARQLDPGCSYLYYETMSDMTGQILRKQLTLSCEDLAGVYIAAWEEAGKPVHAQQARTDLLGQAIIASVSAIRSLAEVRGQSPRIRTGRTYIVSTLWLSAMSMISIIVWITPTSISLSIPK